MVTWNQFVKDIREKRKVSHKEAMKIASPLWAAQKGPTKKKKQPKKKIEAPPEISEFPKPKKKTKGTRQTIAKTTTKSVTDLGGSLTDTFIRKGKRTRWSDFKKRNSILLDSAHKFTSRRSKVSRV